MARHNDIDTIRALTAIPYIQFVRLVILIVRLVAVIVRWLQPLLGLRALNE